MIHVYSEEPPAARPARPWWATTRSWASSGSASRRTAGLAPR